MRLKKSVVSLLLIIVSIIYILLIKLVDVASIGPRSSEVGFSSINGWFNNIFTKGNRIVLKIFCIPKAEKRPPDFIPRDEDEEYELEKEHNIFKRQENNIIFNLEIPVIDAILGTEKAKDLVVKKTGIDLLAHTIEICNRCTGIDELTIYKYLSTICKLDAITLNEDRHLNNIAFIYDGKKYRLAPIFDNGMGLLADTESFPLNKGYSVWMQSVRARPFCSDFIEQALLFEDFGPLKLDYVNFVNEVNKIRIPERDKEFERAKGVLMRRLEETKGVVWDAI